MNPSEADEIFASIRETTAQADPHRDVERQDRDLFGSVLHESFVMTLTEDERACLQRAADVHPECLKGDLGHYLKLLFVEAVSTRLDELESAEPTP